MGLIDQLKGDRSEVSTKVMAVPVLITILTYILFIIIMQWIHFFPVMESAAEETKDLTGETGDIQGEYIGEIKLAQILSFLCFGLLDCLFAFILWKGKVPKNREIKTRMLINNYPVIRMSSAFIIIMLSITVIIGNSPRFLMNLLYLIILIFSIVSFIIILYFKRKSLNQKMEEEILFKIPVESSL